MLNTPKMRQSAESQPIESFESPVAATEASPRGPTVLRRSLLAGLLLVALVLGTRGITSEASVSLYDTPRYLMNGAFLTDFVGSGAWSSFSGAIRYAERYYAHYPALSLGHHPPLISVALIPVYALVGPSVFWARVVALGFFLLATGALFSLARRFYTLEVAFWATALFVTNPFVVKFGQQVLSEMPMLALVLVSMDALVRFSVSRQGKHYAWFVAAAVLSLYAKQLAIYLFPVFAAFLLVRVGWRRLVSRDVIVMTAVGALLSAPIVVMTLTLSPASVELAQGVATRGTGLSNWRLVLSNIFNIHLALPILIVVFLGIVASTFRRDRRVILGVAWLGAVVGSVILFTGRFDSARYAMAAMPAYFLCAASLVTCARSKRERWAAIAMLSFAVGCQLWLVRNIKPTGAGGYETAAQYVVSGASSPTVLYSGPIDVGYFVFFVRKHDPAGRIVVLRAEKLLTTRTGQPGVQIGSGNEEEFYASLRRYGTRYVVIEDRPGNRALDRLRDEVKTDRFIERLRIPIETKDPRLLGVDLVVYEYKGAQPPDLNAGIDIKLPLVRREINVRLADLVGSPNKH